MIMPGTLSTWSEPAAAVAHPHAAFLQMTSLSLVTLPVCAQRQTMFHDSIGHRAPVKHAVLPIITSHFFAANTSNISHNCDT